MELEKNIQSFHNKGNSTFKAMLYIVAFLFLIRVLDIFVIQSDKWFGEQIVTKVVGIIIVFSYLKFKELPLNTIGLTKKQIKRSIFLGVTLILAALTIGYFTEYLYLFLAGKNPYIYFNPQQNTLLPTKIIPGSVMFAIILILGNIINSLMEEGLFRGLLMFGLREKLNLKTTILLQGILFGLWHIFWPLRDYFYSQTTLTECFVTCLVYCTISSIIGFA